MGRRRLRHIPVKRWKPRITFRRNTEKFDCFECGKTILVQLHRDEDHAKMSCRNCGTEDNLYREIKVYEEAVDFYCIFADRYYQAKLALFPAEDVKPPEPLSEPLPDYVVESMIRGHS